MTDIRYDAFFNHAYLLGTEKMKKQVPPVYRLIRERYANETVIIRAYDVLYEENTDVIDQESLIIRFKIRLINDLIKTNSPICKLEL